MKVADIIRQGEVLVELDEKHCDEHFAKHSEEYQIEIAIAIETMAARARSMSDSGHLLVIARLAGMALRRAVMREAIALLERNPEAEARDEALLKTTRALGNARDKNKGEKQ